MGSISPSTATISPSGTQALTSSGVTSPKWYIKDSLSGDSLTGVSGSNATYNAPAGTGVAKVRAEEEFWTGFYDAAGSSGSDNSATLALGARCLSNAHLETINDSFKWVLPSGFTSDAGHSFGVRENTTGNVWRLHGDGSFKFNVTNETTGLSLSDGDEIEIKAETVSGAQKVRVYKNGTLLYTSTNNLISIGSTFYLHTELRSASDAVTWPHPEVFGAWTGWSYGESVITVAATPPDDMVLSTPTVVNAGEIDVPFTEDGDFESIKVQRDTVNTFDSGDFVEYTDQPSDSPFVNDSDLNPTVTTEYFYRAKAKNADDAFSDNWSNIVSATIEVPLVADFNIPSELEASDKLLPENLTTSADSYEWRVNGELVSTDFEPELTLSLVMGENTVELKAVNDDGDDTQEKTVTVIPKIINVGNVTSYVLEDLTEGLTVRGRVRAVDGAGNKSDWSNTATATVGVDGFFLIDSEGFSLIDSDGDSLIVEG